MTSVDSDRNDRQLRAPHARFLEGVGAATFVRLKNLYVAVPEDVEAERRARELTQNAGHISQPIFVSLDARPSERFLFE